MIITPKTKVVAAHMILAYCISIGIAGRCGDEPLSNMPDKVSKDERPLNVAPGPLEVERKALLGKLQLADQKGVGIQPYMTLFSELEQMASHQGSEKEISARLNTIDSALSDQLSWQNAMLHHRFSNHPTPMIEEKNEVLLPLQKAREYSLLLINSDRAKYHLPPVKLDPVASLAGQRHTEEMATEGYFSHWDLSGKKPCQRYNEVGGTHEDSENFAGSYGNCLSRNSLFSAQDLKRFESMFMSEKPPNDGHRVQILCREHNKVGIGLSSCTYGERLSRVCLVQEFIDEYGQYEKLSESIFRGKPFKVGGSLNPGLKVKLISICWEPEPKPMTLEQLSKTGSYGNGDNVEAFYPEGTASHLKIWMQRERQHFSVQITAQDDWKAGIYYVSIYANRAKDEAHKEFLVSTRITHLH